MLSRFKQRLGDVIRRRVDERWEQLMPQVVSRVDDLRRELHDMGGHFGADYGYMRAEFDRIAPQVAALEYRFEMLTQQLKVQDPDDVASHAQREHERARLRMELVSHYEERLRRLEHPGA